MALRSIQHRYFFGLLPGAQEAHRIHAFAEELPGPWELLTASRLHVTVAITEDLPVPMPALVAALLRAGEAVRAEPFEIVLDRLSASPRSIALRPARVIPELKELHAAVREAMTAEGVPLRKDWRFSPHMTLGYGEARPFVKPVQPFGWKVGELLLIHGLAGANRHEVLGRWTLEPAPEKQLSLFAA